MSSSMGGKVSDQLRSSDGYHDALKEHRRRVYGELVPGGGKLSPEGGKLPPGGELSSRGDLSQGGELSPVERKEALKSFSSDVNNDS